MTKARKALLRVLVVSHLVGLALLFGGTAAVVVLIHAGEQVAMGAHRSFAFEVSARLQDIVLLPGSLALVASGLLLSLLGPWGLVKHRWMVAKLVGTAILAMHGQVQYRPMTHLLLEWVRMDALPADWPDLVFHLQRLGVIQLVALVAVSAVGVVKPWGRTRFGLPPATSAASE
ncbi:MAG: hypothetical protein HYS27_27870 [Deltaproteobacteria bacterium]|nr:hypothetical protein [Deltaproteobacteria bacterium]